MLTMRDVDRTNPKTDRLGVRVTSAEKAALERAAARQKSRRCLFFVVEGSAKPFPERLIGHGAVALSTVGASTSP